MAYNEKVNLQTFRPDNSEVLQSHSQALAQFANQIGQGNRSHVEAINQWYQFAENKQTQAATADATAAIKKGGKPEFKGGKSAYSQTYDDLMRKAYLSTLARDTEQDLQKIESDSPDLVTYNKQVDAYHQGKIKEIDPTTAPLFSDAFNKLSHSARMRVQDKEIETNKANAEGEILRSTEASSKSLLTAMNEGTPEEVSHYAQQFAFNLDTLNKKDPNKYSTAWVAEQTTKMHKEVSTQGFIRDFNSALDKGLDYGKKKLSELSAETPKGYSPDEWEKVLGKMYGQVYAIEKANKRSAKENKKAMEQNELLARGDYIIANGIPIDPKKTDEIAKQDLNAVNAFYNNNIPQIESMPINERINYNVEFIAKTGIIPLRLQSNANAFARSGSIEQLTAATELYARVQQTTPNALKDLTPETEAILSMVNEAQMAGSDLEAAVIEARKHVYGQTEQEKQAIKITSSAYKKNNSKVLFDGLQENIDVDFDQEGLKGYFTSPPDASDAVKAEYSVAFDKKMILTGGNAELSQQLAYKDLKKTWGVTRVNGKAEFMKFAPESVYGVHGADNSWIKNQFDKDMADNGIDGAVITVNPNIAMRQGKPVYVVNAPDANGILQPVFKPDANGNVKMVTWNPDYRETEEYKIENNIPDSTGKISTAREKYERMKALELNRGISDVRTRLGKNITSENIDAAVNNSIATGKASEADREELTKYFMEKMNAN